MDSYEATKTVLSRIQSLDPDNASKIMGYILIQDQGDKEMIRLAFGPEAHLLSLISQAKSRLGLSSNISSAPNPRVLIPPSSPSWSPSYAAVVNGNAAFEVQESFEDPIMSPSGRSDSLVFPYDESIGSPHHHHHHHRRSFSVNDAFAEDCGGWRPCMYYARGFCKNGSSCKFLHNAFLDSSSPIGSPSSKVDSFDDFLRIKALQQQHHRLLASRHPLAYNNNFTDNQRSAAAALMMEEEFHKFGRCRPDRNGFSAVPMNGISSSSSRQIYLTFPADSTFKEEDVSNYFSMYGPVQDVRIPYQQKRMFGFVTFVYPETVKQILAKGNPHFVCDSRVLVKPYQEKGKVADRKQMQQQHLPIERGELSACLSPSGLESREPYDHPFGGRMFYNSQEMMLRRKLEQEAELQQAIELQGRRLMNLQFMDLKNQLRDDHFPPSLSPGLPTASQMQFHTQNTTSFVPGSNVIDQEIPAESNDTHEAIKSPTNTADEKVPQEMLPSDIANENDSKEKTTNIEDSNIQESLEHILPDSLFASPKKSAADQAAFSSDLAEAGVTSPITSATSNNIPPMLPTTSTLSMASLKSCNFHMPRFTFRQEAFEM